MLAKGFLYDVEYEDLGGSAEVRADAVLRRRLEAAMKRPFAKARSDNERLDRATERNFRANLEIINQPGLYAVLRGVDPAISSTSAPEVLIAAADKLYRKARNTADKSRPETGALRTLAAIANREADIQFGRDAAAVQLLHAACIAGCHSR